MIGDNVGTCGVSDSIMDEVWTKFVVNCGGNLLAAITSWDTRELGINDTARLRWKLQAEAITVAERLGYKLRSFAGSVGVVLTSEDIRQASEGQRPDLEQQVLEQAKESIIVTRPSTLHDASGAPPWRWSSSTGTW